MIVLCTGMPRSGSTWSYNASVAILETRTPGSVHGLYAQEFAPVLRDYAARGGDLVVKCHAVDQAGMTLIESRQAKLVYTYRDPRPAIASGMGMFGHSFETMLGFIRASLEFMDCQRARGDVLLISYPELMERPRRAIRAIADHLAVGLAEVALAAIEQRCSREAMAEFAARAGQFPAEEVYRDGDVLYHRRTLIHRNHFQTTGLDWRIFLSEEQLSTIREKLRPWATWFGWRGDAAADDEVKPG